MIPSPRATRNGTYRKTSQLGRGYNFTVLLLELQNELRDLIALFISDTLIVLLSPESEEKKQSRLLFF